MRCPHCHTEQGEHQFCTDCGKPLNLEAAADLMPNEKSNQEDLELISGEATNQEAAAEAASDSYADFADVAEEREADSVAKADEGMQAGMSASATDQPSPGQSERSLGASALRVVLAPAVSLVVLILTSIGLGLWFKGSDYVREWMYRLYTRNWGFGTQEAVAAADSHGWSWWHVFGQMHAAEIHTTWRWATGEEASDMLQFSVEWPLLGLVIISLIVIFIVQWAMQRADRRKENGLEELVEQSALWQTIRLLLQAVVYGLLTALVLVLLDPSKRFELPSPLAGLRMEETVGLFDVWLKASGVYAAAALVAKFMRRRSKHLHPGEAEPTSVSINSGFTMAVRWAVLVIAITLFVGSLMPVVWSLSASSSFYEQPAISIVHQWQAHAGDPVLLAMLPTFWLQEWLYATGGVVHLKGVLLTNLLQLEPMSLHLVTGVSVPETIGEPSSALRSLAAAARGNWHVWSMLLLTIYGTARFAAHRSWLSIIVFSASAGVFAAIVARLSTLSINMPDMLADEVQRLGHGPLFAAIQVPIVCLVSAAIGKLLHARIEKTSTSTEVRADG